MSQSKKTFLICKIQKGPGLFDDERFVEIVVGDTTYTTIVDREDVQVDETLREDTGVMGRLRVYQVERRGEDAFVILPREVAGHGRRLLVPQNLLQSF